jgi:RNA polymerase sigma factor (sigma-70 family)
MPMDPREEAFAAYRNYLRTLQAIHISPRLRAKLDHSDLVQKTIADALVEADRLASLSEEARRRRLYTMMLNNLRDEVRHFTNKGHDVGREQPLLAEAGRSSASIHQWLPSEQPEPPALAEQAEVRERLLNALAALDPEECEAVTLQRLHGWTLAEIAALQKRTVGAVVGTIARALKDLRPLIPELE